MLVDCQHEFVKTDEDVEYNLKFDSSAKPVLKGVVWKCQLCSKRIIRNP